MGLMIHSLCELPADGGSYNRDFYVYLLDYGWEEGLSTEMYRHFPRMAEAASRHGAVVLRGTVGHHFADEVLSWHQVNGSDAKGLLPAILVTTKHPQAFHEGCWITTGTTVQHDRLLLIPLRGVCRSPSDVAPLIERLFSDIQQKQRLSQFEIAKRMVAGREGAILDAVVLKPSLAETGLELSEAVSFLSSDRRIEGTVMQQPTAQADVLLITVNPYETQAVLHAFEAAAGSAPTPVSIEDRVYRDLGTVNGMRIFHALSEMGSGGLGATQQTVDKAIRALSPGAVIAVGIAFGIDAKKQAIGDVLLSKQLRLYDLQREGKEILLRGDKPHASPRLINFFEGASQTSWQGQQVWPGVILTGEKLVDNLDYREQLAAFEPEAVGGEMEGAGVYVASHDHKVDWIVIKAICDWGDGQKTKNKKTRQKKAAKNAAEFLLHALQQARLNSRTASGVARTTTTPAQSVKFDARPLTAAAENPLDPCAVVSLSNIKAYHRSISFEVCLENTGTVSIREFRAVGRVVVSSNFQIEKNYRGQVPGLLSDNGDSHQYRDGWPPPDDSPYRNSYRPKSSNQNMSVQVHPGDVFLIQRYHLGFYRWAPMTEESKRETWDYIIASCKANFDNNGMAAEEKEERLRLLRKKLQDGDMPIEPERFEYVWKIYLKDRVPIEGTIALLERWGRR